jgi:hypothetical protein
VGKARSAANGKARQVNTISARELRAIVADTRALADGMAELRRSTSVRIDQPPPDSSLVELTQTQSA